MEPNGDDDDDAAFAALRFPIEQPLPSPSLKREWSMSKSIRAVQSPAAAIRLREARAFVDQFAPGDEVLLLGASRGAVDDFARGIAVDKGPRSGCIDCRSRNSRRSWRCCNWPRTIARHRPRLGHEAVATRATFEANRDDVLEYFSPVARTPGFPTSARAHADRAATGRHVGRAAERLSVEAGQTWRSCWTAWNC